MRNDRWFSRACLWSSPLANWEAPALCRRSHAGAVFHRHLAPPCRRKSQTCLLSCPGDAPSGSRTVVAARVARARGADGPPADRASFSIISTRQKLMPRSNRLDQRGNAETYRNAPPYSRFDLCSRRIRGRWISLFMALLRVDRATRAYMPKASNAAPPIATMTGTSHCLKVKHSSLSNSATNCCNLFVVETRLFGFKACEVSVCAACTSVPVACTKLRGRRERQSGQNGRSKRKDAWKCAGAADRKRSCHGGLAIGFRRSFQNWVRDRLGRRHVRASICWRRLSDSYRHQYF